MSSLVRNRASLVAVLVIHFIMLLPVSVFSQSIWLGLDHDKYLTIEFLQPNFEGENDKMFDNFAFFFSLRHPLGENVLLSGELPFARGSDIKDSSFSVAASQVFGNPYLGVEIRQKKSHVFGEFGIRIPVIHNERRSDWITGLISDIDRSEAFAPNIISGQFMLNYEHETGEGIKIRFRLGPILQIHRKTRQEETFLSYATLVGYHAKKLTFRTGFTGRAVLGGEGSNLGERTIHQIGISFQYTLGYVTPGLHLRFPLDKDLGDIVDYVLGVNIKLLLR